MCVQIMWTHPLPTHFPKHFAREERSCLIHRRQSSRGWERREDETGLGDSQLQAPDKGATGREEPGTVMLPGTGGGEQGGKPGHSWRGATVPRAAPSQLPGKNCPYVTDVDTKAKGGSAICSGF